VVIGPGKGAVGAPDVLFDRPKMLLKVWVVKEPRRARGEESGEVFSLLDMLMVGMYDAGRAFDITTKMTEGVVVVGERFLQ
jgi:hypothetical protein